jgi:hypothetical protein
MLNLHVMGRIIKPAIPPLERDLGLQNGPLLMKTVSARPVLLSGTKPQLCCARQRQYHRDVNAQGGEGIQSGTGGRGSRIQAGAAILAQIGS